MGEVLTNVQDVRQDIIGLAREFEQTRSGFTLVVPGLTVRSHQQLTAVQQHSHLDCSGPTEWTTEQALYEADVKSLEIGRNGWGFDSGVRLTLGTSEGSIRLVPNTEVPAERAFDHWPDFTLDPSKKETDPAFDEMFKGALRTRGIGTGVTPRELLDKSLFDDVTHDVVAQAADPLHAAPDYRRQLPLGDYTVGTVSFYNAGDDTQVALVSGERWVSSEDKSMGFVPLDQLEFRRREVTYASDLLARLGGRALELAKNRGELAANVELNTRLRHLNTLLETNAIVAKTGLRYDQTKDVLMGAYDGSRVRQITGQRISGDGMPAHRVIREEVSGELFVVDTAAGLAISLEAFAFSSVGHIFELVRRRA